MAVFGERCRPGSRPGCPHLRTPRPASPLRRRPRSGHTPAPRPELTPSPGLAGSCRRAGLGCCGPCDGTFRVAATGPRPEPALWGAVMEATPDGGLGCPPTSPPTRRSGRKTAKLPPPRHKPRWLAEKAAGGSGRVRPGRARRARPLPAGRRHVGRDPPRPSVRPEGVAPRELRSPGRRVGACPPPVAPWARSSPRAAGPPCRGLRSRAGRPRWCPLTSRR